MEQIALRLVSLWETRGCRCLSSCKQLCTSGVLSNVIISLICDKEGLILSLIEKRVVAGVEGKLNANQKIINGPKSTDSNETFK